MKHEKFDLPIIGRAAAVVPASINLEERTIDIVWTTGATVQRARWVGWDIEYYDEELGCEDGNLRLERLNGSAPFLNSHSSYSLSDVLGVIVEGSARMEGGKGYATVRFSKREEVDGIWSDISGGIIRNVSVGYRVHEYQITKKDGERDHYLAVDWEPFEVSAVAIGADAGSQTRSEDLMNGTTTTCVLTRMDAKNAAAAAPLKGEDMTKNNNGGDGKRSANDPQTNGDDNTRANDPAGGAPAADDNTRANDPAPSATAGGDGTRSNGSGAPTGGLTQADVSAAIAAERARSELVGDLCRTHGMTDDFARTLVNSGATEEQARKQIMDKLAEDAPFAGRSSERSPANARGEDGQALGRAAGIENAILARANPSVVALTEDGRQFRGMALMELARQHLEHAGVNVRDMGRMQFAARVFETRAGSHSTSDFPTILANIANKTLLSAYDATPRTFGSWARRSTITDFKEVTRASLSGAPDLKKVLESGEFKYGTMGESKEVYGLATYGRIIAITRQTLINDDLDAFTRIPAAFGASASDLESDIVYNILMSNPTMGDGVTLFHADRGNLVSGSKITEAALAAAYRSYGMKKNKGKEGRLIAVQPKYILVPPGKRSVEARKQVAVTTAANTDDVNPFTNSLSVVEEPRLLPATGQDPWFLASDYNRVDTIEFAYLDGQEGLFTETRNGFETDGLEIKARHDFAAKAIDSMGLYKNPGAA